jgi:hypothetical protein
MLMHVVLAGSHDVAFTVADACAIAPVVDCCCALFFSDFAA